MIKVGIIGFGTIGSALARSCLTLFKSEVRLIGIIDRDLRRETQARKKLGISRRYSLKELIADSDLIIEAAEARSAYRIAKNAISSGKDVMIMSAGGLVHHEHEILKLARDHRSCLYLPSGAVTGLDGLKSAGIGKIKSVLLSTRKPPESLKGAPYLSRKRTNLDKIRKETLIFKGSAEQAIAGFPQNINVSATLSLAGLGPRKTRVKIFACPGLGRHIHEVYVKGEFGTFYTRTENLPSAQNPKTSHLAVFSAVATLKRILSNVKIGT